MRTYGTCSGSLVLLSGFSLVSYPTLQRVLPGSTSILGRLWRFPEQARRPTPPGYALAALTLTNKYLPTQVMKQTAPTYLYAPPSSLPSYRLFFFSFCRSLPFLSVSRSSISFIQIRPPSRLILPFIDQIFSNLLIIMNMFLRSPRFSSSVLPFNLRRMRSCRLFLLRFRFLCCSPALF